jgi:hypothetical protein
VKHIALACSKLLADHVRWSLPLLEKRMVALGIVEAARGNMIHRMPKNALKMHKSRCWVDPTHGQRRLCRCDGRRSGGLNSGLGSEARLDYECERAGVASLLMLFAPLEGWCHVAVRERRTTIMRTSSRTSPTTIFLTLIRLLCYLRSFHSPRLAVLLNHLSGHIL